jgi:hypothetical protein
VSPWSWLDALLERRVAWGVELCAVPFQAEIASTSILMSVATATVR